MKLIPHHFVAALLTGLLSLTSGCNRTAPLSSSESTITETTHPIAAPSITPETNAPTGEFAIAVQTAINAATAAAQTQNYSNAMESFDVLRASGKLTPDQLERVHDAETRMMRELAAKGAAGDQDALRQFRELADRSRTGH